MTDSQEKLRKYEEFANEKLKSALENVTKLQQLVNNEIIEYTQLKKTLSVLEPKIKTKVDLGFQIFMNAEAETEMFMIDVGHDFYVEMNKSEATTFIDKKVKLLEKKLACLNDEAASFQGQIRFVMEGIRELNPDN